MNNFYLIKEEGSLYDAFAIVVERQKDTETIKSITTSINDQYDCDCCIGFLDFNELRNTNTSQILHVYTGGNATINMVVSKVRLY